MRERCGTVPATATPEPFEVPEFPLEGEPALTPEPEPAARYLVRGGRDSLDRLEGRDVARVQAQVKAQTARPLEQRLALEGPDRWEGTYWEGGREWSDWHRGPTDPDPLDAGRCSPSVDQRMRRWDLEDGGKFHITARGVCACGWTGPERTQERDGDYDGPAWCDALDHAYAGWRETPALPWPGWTSDAKAPVYMSGKPKEKVLAQWMALLRAGGYPEAWIGRPDAPVRFIRPASDGDRQGRFVIPTYGPWGNLAVYFPPATSAPPSAGPARQADLFNPRAEIINRYSTSQEQRDEATEELTNDDIASHLAGLHDQMQEEIDRAPEGSERKREAILTRDQARADLEELLLFGGDTESES